MNALVLLFFGWLAVVAGVLWLFRDRLHRLWREPVFACPVLVLESDDWGAGPVQQAETLREIGAVFGQHRDATGRTPVMSLAIVLAVPDGEAIAVGGEYQHVSLSDRRLGPVLDAVRTGLSTGVFSVQLHGHEHFWPLTLIASNDPAVRAWLTQPAPAATEQLPSHLQSRWVDASRLPSSPLPAAQIHAAVAEEVAEFRRVFGHTPAAVVPPTFVWTREVERAWAAAGVEFVVTPGWRSTLRDAAGRPEGDEGPIGNGDRDGRITYLVRTDYFEPARGRDAAYALNALARATAQGQPCVLENHRDNFIFDEAQCRRSLAELNSLCDGALRQHPGVRFVSTAELGRIVRERDTQWIVSSWRERLPFVWERLRQTGRPWKLLRLLGAAALGTVVVRWLGVRPSQAAGPHS